MVFFHGVRTQSVDVGLRPVRDTEVGVIGLVGTAPMYKVDEAFRSLNEPVQVLNRNQAQQFFGVDTVGYTIPSALDAIFDQVDFFGGVKVVVVNVFDLSDPVQDTPIVDEMHTWDVNDQIDLMTRVENVTVNVDLGGSAGATLIEGVDYTINYSFGLLTRIDGGSSGPLSDVLIDYTPVSGGNIGTVIDEENTFSATNTFFLPEGLSNVVITGIGGTPTYVEDTDYTVDLISGLVTRLASGSIPAEATVECSYNFADPSTVSPAQIIGGVDSNGSRTGMEALRDTFNLYGYFPHLVIVPSYSTLNSITSAIDVIVNSIDAIGIIDAPIGTSYNQVLQGRGPNGDINFNYSSDRLAGCYPHLKIFRNVTNAEELEPYSQRLAGVWANKAVARGFWWSPSNSEIRGIIGTEVPLEFIPGTQSDEVNTLNAAGIVTYINFYGSGIRTWGNRGFAYPTTTAPNNFLNIKYADIIINERVRFFGQQYVDYPISDALIDAFLDSLNAFYRTLITLGALIEGSRVYYDPNDNPAEDLANGKIVFREEKLPPPPAENITVRTFLNVELAGNLNIGRELIQGV